MIRGVNKDGMWAYLLGEPVLEVFDAFNCGASPYEEGIGKNELETLLGVN